MTSGTFYVLNTEEMSRAGTGLHDQVAGCGSRRKTRSLETKVTGTFIMPELTSYVA